MKKTSKRKIAPAAQKVRPSRRTEPMTPVHARAKSARRRSRPMPNQTTHRPTDQPPTAGAPDAASVFLSPRVVDRGAFNEFAGALRRLVEDASAHAGQLRAATEQAAELREQIRAGEPKLAAAAKVIATLDQRAGQAEALLDAARSASGGLETLRREAEGVLNQKLAEFQARLDEAADRSRRALEAVIERAGTAIAAAHEEAAALEGRANGIVADAAARLDEHATLGRSRLERAVADGAGAVEAAEQRAAAPAERLRGLIERAEALLGEATEPAPESLLPSELTTEATGGAGGSGSESLGAALRRAEQARDDARRIVHELDEARDRAGAARSHLVEALESGSQEVARLAERAASLRASLADALSAADGARARLEERRAELRAALNEPLAEIDAAGAALRANLEPLIARAEAARQTARQAEAGMGALLERISGLMDDLAPWRGVLIEGKGQIPGPIRDLVDQVRAELTADLSSIADAMRSITTRAGSLAERVRPRE